MVVLWGAVPAASLPLTVNRITVNRAWWCWRELERLVVLCGVCTCCLTTAFRVTVNRAISRYRQYIRLTVNGFRIMDFVV